MTLTLHESRYLYASERVSKLIYAFGAATRYSRLPVRNQLATRKLPEH